MITIPVSLSDLPILVGESSNNSNGLARLLAAAIVSKEFCRMLLDDPERALEEGYQGETFFLTKEEYDTLLSIHAASLTELARRMTLLMSKNTYLMQQVYQQ
jgi:hypothetical protein